MVAPTEGQELSQQLGADQTFWVPTEDVRRHIDCRVLVGGVGNPWLRDMDFGPQFVRTIRELEWPADVVIEDLAVSAHRVLHLLQETTPERVIFIAGYSRGDAPGAIRRTMANTTPIPAAEEEDVEGMLGEAAGGVVDFDHTLIVTRYFKALPEDTVIIEVEAIDTAFGTGFSPEVEACIEPVLEMVRKEIER